MSKYSLALLLILILALSASAQLESGSTYLIVNGGYASAQLKTTENQADGGSIGLVLNSQSWSKPVSFFMSIVYTSLERGATEDDLGVQYDVTALPLTLGLRAWLGYGKFQGYIGGGLIVYFANVKRAVGTAGYSDNNSNGWGMAVPLGLSYAINEKFFINLDYSMDFLLDTDAFESNLLNIVSLGFGFRIKG